MPFLLTHVPWFGNGWVIGVNGVLHVLVSHGLAIGVIFLVALADYLGARRGRPEWEAHAERMLKPAVIAITGIGAVTGAGLWLTTGALSPRGVGSLLRIFFWPWFIEWLVFVLEVGILLAYYFGWRRWPAGRAGGRWRLGAAYAFFAALSAVLVTGILAFMLTPDGWPLGHTFRAAFFNPSFAPQLFFRLGLSVALGALFGLAFLLFPRHSDEFRRRALPVYGAILAAGAAASAAFAAWYFAVAPSRFKAHALFAVLTSRLSGRPLVFWAGNAAGLAFLAALAAAGLARRPRAAKALVLPALVAAVALTAEFERMREFIRGPYLVPGYMYSNQLLLGEEDYFSERGLLPSSPWLEAAGPAGDLRDGAFLFLQNCGSCHTIAGLNGIARRVRGRSRDGLDVLVSRLHDIVPFMPPFAGTEEERRRLVEFLDRLGRGEIRVSPASRFLSPAERTDE